MDAATGFAPDAPPLADAAEEAALVERVGQGDRGACTVLVERHLPPVVAFAARLLGDRAEAEDVAQETFLRLWRHAHRWQPRARLSTWLHRVAYNLCIDRLRRARTAPLEEAPDPPDPAPDAAEVLGVGIRALESLLARGRRTLRAELAGRRQELLEEP